MDGGFIAGDRGLCVAQRFIGRQIEGKGGGHELTLVIDGERRMGGSVMSDGAKRHHRFRRGGYRGTGRRSYFSRYW